MVQAPAAVAIRSEPAGCRQYEKCGDDRRHNNHLLTWSPDLTTRRRKTFAFLLLPLAFFPQVVDQKTARAVARALVSRHKGQCAMTLACSLAAPAGGEKAGKSEQILAAFREFFGLARRPSPAAAAREWLWGSRRSCCSNLAIQVLRPWLTFLVHDGAWFLRRVSVSPHRELRTKN